MRYNYRSKDAGDLPFTVNVFNSKKQSKTIVTLELEANTSCNLSFKQLEMITLAIYMGDKPSNVEIVKISPNH